MITNKIVVIGSTNTDMVVNSTKLPLPVETLMGGTFFMNVVGKGSNQAVASARLGGGVTLIAKLGNDIFGKETIEGLANEQIKTEFILVDDENAKKFLQSLRQDYIPASPKTPLI